MKKLLTGIIAAAGGILVFFTFFAMWKSTGTILGATSTEYNGIFKFTGDNAGKIVTADVFALIGFIAGCLFAAVFLLEFLGILKGKNAKMAGAGASCLMLLSGILTIIFVIVATNDSSFSLGGLASASFSAGYGAWIAMIGLVVGGLSGFYWSTLVSAKKGKKK